MLKKFKTVISEIFQERSTHILFVIYADYLQSAHGTTGSFRF